MMRGAFRAQLKGPAMVPPGGGMSCTLPTAIRGPILPASRLHAGYEEAVLLAGGQLLPLVNDLRDPPPDPESPLLRSCEWTAGLRTSISALQFVPRPIGLLRL